jgi:hypothetical protein
VYILSPVRGTVINNNRFWILLQLQAIITAQKQWLPKTRSIPYWTTSVFSSALLTWFWFTNRLLLFPLSAGWHSTAEHWTLLWMPNEEVTLPLAVYGQSVRLGAEPLETHGQNCFFFLVNTCGYRPYIRSSLRRGWVCVQLLLAFASAFILGSESCGTWDHILLSQIRDFHFCRLTPDWRITCDWTLMKWNSFQENRIYT